MYYKTAAREHNCLHMYYKMFSSFQPLMTSFSFDTIHFGMGMVPAFILGGIMPPAGETLRRSAFGGLIIR